MAVDALGGPGSGSEPRISAAELARSPLWFPLDCEKPDGVRLVHLDEAAYRAASFLDQRILKSNPRQGFCAAAVLTQAASQLAPAAHFIFHIGHVGSTLVSRLVGEDPRIFALREPLLLRPHAMAGGSCPIPLAAVVALVSRTWRTEQFPVVKVSSFVSEIAGPVMDAAPRSRAILMYVPAPIYLRSIMAGQNSRAESRALAPSRLARLRRRLSPIRIPDPASRGESIAMSWLCEMTALCQAAAVFPGRVHWVEFERFLDDPRPGLAGVFTALGMSPDERAIDAALRGPLMRQYSKAPEHAYDRELRRRVLAEADWEHRDEIGNGMRWLSRLAGGHRLIDRALEL